MVPPTVARANQWRYDERMSPIRRYLDRSHAKGVCTALGLSLLTLVQPSAAFDHIVRPTDTLASIAEEMYGRIQYERLLVAANALEAQGGSRISAGMRLEVPAVTHLRIGQGQTWESLAADLLGSPKRAAVLAEANGTKPWLPPEQDAEIVIPFNLRIIATGNETIVGLAYEYLGDRRKAWVLDHYNDLNGKRLRRGDVVLIPLTDLPLTEAGKAAARRAAEVTFRESLGERREAQRRVDIELPQLIADVRLGRYVDAAVRGTRFLAHGDKLTRSQRAVIHRQLLEAYVALGATGHASASCEAWRAHDKSAALNPITMSPKLIAACRSSQKPTP